MNRKLCLLLFILCNLYIYSQCEYRYQSIIFNDIDTITRQYGSNITYQGVNQNLYMDIYKSHSDTVRLRPCIVFCFGGAFITGTRKSAELTYMATQLAQKGYVCASIDYRLDNSFNLLNSTASSKAAIRAVQDAKAAIRYLRSIQDSLQIDTSQIFIGGTSAGGVTALTLGYSQYSEFIDTLKHIIDGLGGYEGTSNSINLPSTVKGLFSFSGAISDTNHIGYHDLPIYLNHSVGDQTVPFRSGYPLSGLSPNLIHGSYDIMLRMIHQQGYYKIDSFSGSNHPSFTNLAEIQTTLDSLSVFLYKNLACNYDSSHLSTSVIQSTKTGTLYPIPCSDILYLDPNNNFKDKNIELYNNQGLKLKEIKLIDNKIDISSLNVGFYWLKIGTSHIKFIKN